MTLSGLEMLKYPPSHEIQIFGDIVFFLVGESERHLYYGKAFKEGLSIANNKYLVISSVLNGLI